MLNELVAGVDLIRWNRATPTSMFSAADASQDSKARLPARRNPLGRRAQRAPGRSARAAKRSTRRRRSAGIHAVTERASSRRTRGKCRAAIDAAPLLNLHAKAGRSYRVPNADENALPLRRRRRWRRRPRATSNWASPSAARHARLGARAFRHDARRRDLLRPDHRLRRQHQPRPDPAPGRGARRPGAPRRRLARDRPACSTCRPNSPTARTPAARWCWCRRTCVTARLSWAPASGHSADIGVQWVDSQRYGNDFTNSCGARIPSYTTVDARYARQLGAVGVRAWPGLNLADKQYYSNAFCCRARHLPGRRPPVARLGALRLLRRPHDRAADPPHATAPSLALLASAALAVLLASGDGRLGQHSAVRAAGGAGRTAGGRRGRHRRRRCSTCASAAPARRFATGAALALAGVMMQALLRNPLADPYVLGISSGAAVGALAALLGGAALWMVDLGALGGAVGVSLLLYLLARRDLGGGAAARRAGRPEYLAADRRDPGRRPAWRW